MKIVPVRYTKAQLDHAPRDERTLFLMIGALINDLNLHQKVLMAAFNATEDEPEKQAASALASLQVRLIAGRLNEGRILLNDMFGKVSAIYEGPLGQEGLTALQRITAYFADPQNLARRLRNKAAFHDDVPHFLRGYDRVPDDADLVDYLNEHRGNSLYNAAEVVRLFALSQLVNETDYAKAVRKLVAEVFEVVAWFNDFGNEFMRVFVERHLSDFVRQGMDAPIELEKPPSLEDLILPFFCTAPET